MKHYVHRIDKSLSRHVAALPTSAYIPMLVITQFGHTITIVGLTMFLLGIGYASDNQNLMTAAAIAFATSMVSALLKLLWRRRRPLSDYVGRMFFKTYSFPSGHAASTTPLYGLIAYLLLGIAQPWSIAAALITACIPILVGASRVYLGAHYATDVLGGWVLGLSGLAVIVFIVQPTL